ncbi:chemotaxis protein CheW [Agrobacterium leguminum]|uniref:chemotaxis protein CheW n=1 Tax=Agrobacterium leguminum TaxID=2792015 RepID=UPI00272D0389|nr:chemotaxis protein CheW [Agrobacterium leguminum]WLD96330.1 chemotaxis protein CheW [Agrobacterium leguminum]
MNKMLARTNDSLEIIAFMLHEQQFAVRTTSIREIRGWAPVTPLPHTPPEVLGVMNLRGTVIPIVDLSVKLGMVAAEATERSAIVVTSVKGKTIGMMVDRVSDILTITESELQPVPVAAGIAATSYAEGIFARDKDMICFLNLDAIFAASEPGEWEKAA